MKEKIYKYLKMTIVLFMVGALLGIYFVQGEQFTNDPDPTKKVLLDLLIPSMPRGLNWLAVCLFALGWILWEFAVSRMGNKKLGISAIVIILFSTFFTMNFLTYLFAFASGVIMVYILIEKIPHVSEWNLSKTVNKSISDNKKLNQRFKELMSFKRKKNLN